MCRGGGSKYRGGINKAHYPVLVRCWLSWALEIESPGMAYVGDQTDISFSFHIPSTSHFKKTSYNVCFIISVVTSSVSHLLIVVLCIKTITQNIPCAWLNKVKWWKINWISLLICQACFSVAHSLDSCLTYLMIHVSRLLSKCLQVTLLDYWNIVAFKVRVVAQ